jgi:hypothetical protein
MWISWPQACINAVAQSSTPRTNPTTDELNAIYPPLEALYLAHDFTRSRGVHGLLEGRTILKGNDKTALTPIYRYVPGALESMRVSARGPVLLPTSTHGQTAIRALTFIGLPFWRVLLRRNRKSDNSSGNPLLLLVFKLSLMFGRPECGP